MTNPAAPRQTARDEIAAVAAANGWTNVGLDATAQTEDIYRRGDVRIVVEFRASSHRSQVTGRPSVVRFGDLRRSDSSAVTGPRNKRETVIAWLTEGVEQTPAVPTTAREQIATVAAENGWTADVSTATTLRVQRGEIRIVVAYKRDGAVRWAERRRPSTPEFDVVAGADVWIVRDSIASEDSGKRETVIAWLTEAIEQAPAPTTMVTAASFVPDIPRSRGLSMPMTREMGSTPVEQETAEVVDVLGRRVTELETELDRNRVAREGLKAQRDDERIRGDRLAEQLVQAQAEVERREDQVVGYQQSLSEANALVAEQERELLYQRKIRDERGARVAELESERTALSRKVAELTNVIDKLTGATIAVDQAWRDHLDVTGDPQD